MWDPDCVASPGHELGTVSLPRCKACSSFGHAFSLHGFNLNLPWGSPPPNSSSTKSPPQLCMGMPRAVLGVNRQHPQCEGGRAAPLSPSEILSPTTVPGGDVGAAQGQGYGGGGGLVQSHKCWDEIPKLCLCTPRFQGAASEMALMGGSYSSLFNEDIKAWCSAPVCAWDESLGSNCAAKCSLPGTDM